MYGDPPSDYRSTQEVEEWKKKCPILNYKEYLLKKSLVSEKELYEIDREVDDLIKESIIFARNSSFPEPEDALEDIYFMQ